MSLSRTLNPVKSIKFQLAITGPALAIVAALAGAAGSWPMGAAAPSATWGPGGDASAQPRPAASQGTRELPWAATRPELVLASDAQLPVSSLAAARSQAARNWQTAPLGAVRLDAYTAAVTAAKKALVAPLTPRQIARRLMLRFGWQPALQFQSLNLLWIRESNWNVRAYNGYSGAYGIPQAVPAVKLASAGPDWQTSARTQILWGLRYIKARYGSPVLAWEHELAVGWY